MTDDRKALLARLNGARSRGPKSPAGKAASRLNGLRHGLRSRLPVLEWLGETHEGWETFRTQVVTDLAADGPAETALAERFAFTLWRLTRAAKFDAAAATVVLQPVAAIDAPGSGQGMYAGDPGALDDDHDRHLARSVASAAADHRIAADLLADPHQPADDGAVTPGVATALWRCLCRACGVADEERILTLAARFAADCRDPYQAGAYGGWTVGTVRDAVRYTAGIFSREPGSLAETAAVAADTEADRLSARAEAMNRQVADRAGRRSAARVAAAASEAGQQASDLLALAARYEAHLSRELARSLALLQALQATRQSPKRVVEAEVLDGTG